LHRVATSERLRSVCVAIAKLIVNCISGVSLHHFHSSSSFNPFSPFSPPFTPHLSLPSITQFNTDDDDPTITIVQPYVHSADYCHPSHTDTQPVPEHEPTPSTSTVTSPLSAKLPPLSSRDRCDSSVTVERDAKEVDYNSSNSRDEYDRDYDRENYRERIDSGADLFRGSGSTSRSGKNSNQYRNSPMNATTNNSSSSSSRQQRSSSVNDVNDDSLQSGALCQVCRSDLTEIGSRCVECHFS
jgi:hypothetical protein